MTKTAASSGRRQEDDRGLDRKTPPHPRDARRSSPPSRSPVPVYFATRALKAVAALSRAALASVPPRAC
jgi:hypothetical protein